jgi:hypothetical protein
MVSWNIDAQKSFKAGWTEGPLSRSTFLQVQSFPHGTNQAEFVFERPGIWLDVFLQRYIYSI